MSERYEAEELEFPEDYPQTLFKALIEARDRHGRTMEIVEDADFGALSYADLVRAAIAMARELSARTERGERVGMFLPTSVPAVIAFFALQAGGRVPVLFNFSQDAKTLANACELSSVKRIISSKRFIKAGGLEDAIEALGQEAEIDYLEDLKSDISFLDKAAAGAGERIPDLLPDPADPRDPAVILFTSGTTGAPKGVALSHANILANIAQCNQHVPFDPDWVFFNPLPMFHSLGLTGGVLLPILGGMKTVLHPSPLERRTILERIDESGANVLAATDAFARLYARAADEGELDTLEYAVLGGERVEEVTRELWEDKSSARVLEGYGLSEAAPVVALNKPDACKPATVGTLLPGMEARLEDVSGVKEGRQLYVRGPNVMIGYLDPDQDGKIAPMEDEWFDTGDLARIDEDGFITITGRVKRFAKIGGEMVSLDRVEKEANALWSDASSAAMAVSFEDGEAIVLVTDAEDADREAFADHLESEDLDKKLLPKEIVTVEETPMTATGGPDYQRVRRIVRDELDAEPTT